MINGITEHLNIKINLSFAMILILALINPVTAGGETCTCPITSVPTEQITTCAMAQKAFECLQSCQTVYNNACVDPYMCCNYLQLNVPDNLDIKCDNNNINMVCDIVTPTPSPPYYPPSPPYYPPSPPYYPPSPTPYNGDSDTDSETTVLGIRLTTRNLIIIIGLSILILITIVTSIYRKCRRCREQQALKAELESLQTQLVQNEQVAVVISPQKA